MSIYPQNKQVEEVTIEDDSHNLVCKIETEEIEYLLTRGAADRDTPDKHRSELKQSSNHNGTVQVFPDEQNAVAYYLGILQMNAKLSEDDAYEQLTDAGVDMVAYERWQAEFSRDARIQRLIADAKERVTTFGSPWDYAILTESTQFDNLQYNPSIRSTNPNDETAALGESVLDDVPETTSCYRRVVNALERIERNDVAYCEGLAMGRHPSRSSTHAWLEVAGEVIEITWPWDGVRPPDEAVYYGDSLPLKHVYTLANSRPGSGSALLTNEQYFELPEVKQMVANQISIE